MCVRRGDERLASVTPDAGVPRQPGPPARADRAARRAAAAGGRGRRRALRRRATARGASCSRASASSCCSTGTRRSSSSRRSRRGAPSSRSAPASSPASAWSSGVECVIIAHDPTVRGGAMNPYTLQEEPARAGDRPGQPAAGDQPRRVGRRRPAHPGRALRPRRAGSSTTSPSCRRWRIPTIALVFGNSTAGGAYVPGMCDYAVLVDERAKVFLGGPPLVKMATGEESDDEALGGAEMHSRVSGLADYFAVDELDCIRIGREIVRRPQLAQARPGRRGPADEPRLRPRGAARHRVGRPPGAVRPARGARPHRRRLASSTSSSRSTAPALVTGWASIHGYPVGILANAPGVLFSEEAQEGHRVHPARQPDRHAAGVPAEHHRLHGRHATTSSAGSSRTAPR